MSDTPEVKLPVTCSRTGKTQEMKLALEGVEKFLANQRARESNVAVITEFFNSVDTTEIPHLVAFYKGKLVVLPTVLKKSDAAVMRMFHEATQSDTFPKPTPRKRKAKGVDAVTASSNAETESTGEKSVKTAKKNKTAGKSTSDSASAPAS